MFDLISERELLVEVEVGVMWCKIGSEFIPREHARKKSVRWRRGHPEEAEPADDDEDRDPRIEFSVVVYAVKMRLSVLP